MFYIVHSLGYMFFFLTVDMFIFAVYVSDLMLPSIAQRKLSFPTSEVDVR